MASTVQLGTAEAKPAAPTQPSRRSASARLGAAGVLFALIEAAIFHSGFYAAWLHPDSSAGKVMNMLAYERSRPLGQANQLLTVGDSRMMFLPRIADQYAPSSGFGFATIMVPGSSPRVWYYMLREVDPARNRYSAIVIPIDDYDDDDWENLAERAADLHYIAPLVRLSDIASLPGSFESWPLRWESIRSVLLRGWTYHQDFQALLVDYPERMAFIKWVRQEGATAVYEHVPSDHSLKGLSVDYSTRTIHYPEGLDDAGREMIQANLLRGTTPQTGKRAAYRLRWFGRMAEYYRGSRTKLIVMRAPRGPLVRPDLAVDEPSSSIRELARRGDILLMNENLFDELEQPELYADAVHLNNRGSVRFTQLITGEILRLMGAARPAAARAHN